MLDHPVSQSGDWPTVKSKLAALLKKKPLLSFFILAFGITLLGFSLPFYAANVGWIELPFGSWKWALASFFLGGPSLAGLIMAAIGGRKDLRAFVARGLGWRVGFGWYLVAICLPLALGMVSLILVSQLFWSLESLTIGDLLSGLPSSLGLAAVLVGLPLATEFGLRGYAFPRLQDRLGPILASVSLGVFSSLYRFPNHGALSLLAFLVLAVSSSLIMTWLYNKTKGSVLIAGLLAHFATNLSLLMTGTRFLSATTSDELFLRGYVYPFVAVELLAALCLALATRGRLGYEAQPRIKAKKQLATFIVFTAAFLIATVVVVRGEPYKTPVLTRAVFAPSPLASISDFTQFAVHDSEIVRIDGRRERVIFANAEEVAAVRLGPDKTTFHFRVPRDCGQVSSPRSCVDLATPVAPAPKDWSDPPPAEPPFDYLRISEGRYSLEGCHGGYLNDREGFAYIKVPKWRFYKTYDRNELGWGGGFVFEDLEGGHEFTFILDFAGRHTVEALDPRLGFEGLDDSLYFYPSCDYQLDNSIRPGRGNFHLFVFGDFIIPVEFEGPGAPIAGIVPFSSPDEVLRRGFDFLTGEDPRFVLVRARRDEESYLLDTLIDVAFNEYLPLDLEVHSYLFDELPEIESEGDKVTIRIPREEEIKGTGGVADIASAARRYRGQVADRELIRADIEVKEAEIESRFEASGLYDEVRCKFELGEETGCFAMTGMDVYTYVYSFETGLVEVE